MLVFLRSKSLLLHRCEGNKNLHLCSPPPGINTSGQEWLLLSGPMLYSKDAQRQCEHMQGCWCTPLWARNSPNSSDLRTVHQIAGSYRMQRISLLVHACPGTFPGISLVVSNIHIWPYPYIYFLEDMGSTTVFFNTHKEQKSTMKWKYSSSMSNWGKHFLGGKH